MDGRLLWNSRCCWNGLGILMLLKGIPSVGNKAYGVLLRSPKGATNTGRVESKKYLEWREWGVYFKRELVSALFSITFSILI